MKRKDIIKTIRVASRVLDCMDGAVIKDKKTGETVGTIPKDAFEGMQTALIFCAHMLEGAYDPSSALSLISDMTDLHGAVKFGIGEDADD